MHRTEAENATDSNLYTDGPPGTRVRASDRNAIQEEICYAIEQAGLTVEQDSNDSRQQLKSAIEILGQAAAGMPSGTEAWFYQNVAPTGWTIDAVPADAVLAVKGGANAYNANGGTQQGTWTQPAHAHNLTGATFNNHSHTDNFTVDSHAHNLTGVVTDNHTHTDNFSVDAHLHALSGGVATGIASAHKHALSGGVATATFVDHSHAAGTLVIPNHTHDIDTGTAETNASFGNWRCFSQNPGAGLQLIAADYTGGTDTGYPCTDITETDGGGGSVTGNTGTTPSANTLSGNSDNADVNTLSGNTDNTTPGLSGGITSSGSAGVTNNTDATVATLSGGITTSGSGGLSGNTDTSATVNTWRPLAQVGIICTKD